METEVINPNLDPNIIEKIASLMITPKAKIQFIIDRTKTFLREEDNKRRDSPQKGIEEKFGLWISHSNYYEFGNIKEGITHPPLPSCLKNVAIEAISQCFRENNYREGFNIAISYELIEEIGNTIKQISFPTIPSRNNPSLNMQLPIGVENLPGYPTFKKTKKECSYDDRTEPPKILDPKEDIEEIINNTKEIHKDFIKNYLIPKRDINEAIKQLIKIGEKPKAVEVAVEYFDNPKAMVNVCKETQANFEMVLKVLSRYENAHGMISELKSFYFKSLIKGTNFEIGNHYRKWAKAAKLIEHRIDAPSKEKYETTIKQGLEDLTSQLDNLYTSRKNIKNQITEIENALNFFERHRYFPDEFRRKRNHDGTNLSEEKKTLESNLNEIERDMRNGVREEIINLAQMLYNRNISTKEIQEKIYKICETHNDNKTIMELGLHLHDYEKAFRSALYLMHDNSNFHEIVTNIRNIMFPHLTDENRKEFVNRCIRNQHDNIIDNLIESGISTKYNLNEWLITESIRRGRHHHAANIALKLGEKQRAKTIFIESHHYKEAIQLSEDPLEKAQVYFISARKEIKNRTSIYKRYEIEAMLNGIDSLSLFCQNKENHLFNNKNDENYTKTLKEYCVPIIKDLITKKEYLEAILFAQEANIPETEYSKLLDSKTLAYAQESQDFQLCFHIAKIQQDPNANTYLEMAKIKGQMFYDSLKKLSR